MEGYLIAVLDDNSSPKEYWSDDKFKSDITKSKIYTDPKEAIAAFAGLQAQYTSIELKVYKCKSIIQVIPGNPFAATDATAKTNAPTPVTDNSLSVA